MTSVRSTTPEPIIGFYTIRLARGAVPVPARVMLGCACTPLGGDEQKVHDWTPECDRSPTVIGMICGEPCDADRVWRSGSLKGVTQKEYELLLRQHVWDVKYDSTSPLANPNQRVDWLTQKLNF